jgi:hypothetical protein
MLRSPVPAPVRPTSKPAPSSRTRMRPALAADVDQLAAAIRTVAGGGSVIDPRVLERLVAVRARGDSPLAWLTGRESEVPRLRAAP